MCERRLEFDEELYVCFVDFEKAFDRVKWTVFFELLKKIGVERRDRRLIMNLYMQQTAVVKTEDEVSEPGILTSSPINFLMHKKPTDLFKALDVNSVKATP